MLNILPYFESPVHLKSKRFEVLSPTLPPPTQFFSGLLLDTVLFAWVKSACRRPYIYLGGPPDYFLQVGVVLLVAMKGSRVEETSGCELMHLRPSQ